jgi:hypothetical protein
VTRFAALKGTAATVAKRRLVQVIGMVNAVLLVVKRNTTGKLGFGMPR